jgi:bacterioferritin-associated ferredoxin
MYVCVCNAITDREVRGAIALGARSLGDLQATLGVATCCRRCADCAKSILDEAQQATTPAGAGDD